MALMNVYDRPHELPPDDLLAAHLAPEFASIQSQLQARLTAIQARNAELAAQIRGQRSEVEQIVAGLEATMHDLEGANQVLEEAVESQGDDGKGLKNEVKELHAELGNTDVEMKT
jgi:kinetochore protein NNF1